MRRIPVSLCLCAALSLLFVSLAVLPVNAQSAPSWQIETYLGTGVPSVQDIFTYDQDVGVYSIGTTGYKPGEVLSVYVVNDVVTWTNGMSIPPRVAGSAPTITTDTSGGFCKADMWVAAATVQGAYDVVLDTNMNGVYDAGIDRLDSDDAGTAGFTVATLFHTPEAPLGIIGLVASMLVGIAAFFAITKVSRKRPTN